MSSDILYRLFRSARFVPISFVFILLVLFAAGAGLVGLLLGTETAGQPEKSEPSPDQIFPSVQKNASIQQTLRFHVTGPGRSSAWEQEQVRRIDVMNEFRYASTFHDVQPRSVRETRNIDRFRVLLMSSPPGTRVRPEWGITESVDRFQSKGETIQLGRGGLPVNPIEPEEISQEQREQLLAYIQGPDAEQKPPFRFVSYVSPREHTSVELLHEVEGKERKTRFAEPPEIEGLERDVLLHAPVLPKHRLAPQDTDLNRPSSSPDPLNSFTFLTGREVEHYVRPFLSCRLEGTIILHPDKSRSNRFTGSGAYNLLHPNRNKQIGEISVSRIRLSVDSSGLITETTLRGTLSITSVPDRNYLQSIRFLRKPEFRIQYRKTFQK